MQSHSDMSFKAVRHAVIVFATLFAAACSTPTKQNRPVQKAAAKAAASARVDMQQDAAGFTILEDVRVGADVRAEYESAVRMLELQQYEQGIVALLKITESAPNVTAVHIDLGMAYARSGDLDKAEESLKKALQLNPRHPIAYNELGMVYRRKGQFTEARASYEKALDIYPTFHFAQRNLAILCDVYLGDLGCALQHYTAYQQAAPDDAQTAKWLADLNVRAKR